MNFRMVSYADNFEDVLLARAFAGRADGFYVDVGAFDPVEHSVTKHFYDLGWRGINVEPNPGPFARLDAARPGDVNLNLGVSDREGSLTLYSAPSACWSVDRNLLLGWFGASADQIQERTIPVIPLAALLDRHAPPGTVVDFLKVDVEGHEAEVVAGGDWARWRPRVVMIESNNVEAWEPTLLGSGYHFALFEGVNRVYVRDEDRHLVPVLSVPANTGDQFGIHGYLAVIHDLSHRLGESSDLGRNSLALARRIKGLGLRHPRAARVARSILRRLAG